VLEAPGRRPHGGSKGRQRLDQALVERGVFPTRQRAAAAVLAGQVVVDGTPARKAGQMVLPTSDLTTRAPSPYVSRGGGKVAAALDRFAIPVAGCVCLDVGASTGGFTDCLLQRGAARVYAVDVGYGQLAWRLRNDPRVVVKERCNARYLTAAEVPEPVDLATADVSFISLGKVLPAVVARMRVGGPCDSIIALIKPQFEAGPAQVGKGGIVRDAAVHRQVLLRVAGECAALGWPVQALIASPVRGADGNREFLALLRRDAAPRDTAELVRAAVAEAWSAAPAG